MKKLIIAIMALTTMGLNAFAEDGISVPSVSVPQGGTAMLEVNLTTETTAMTAFQFNVSLPDGLTVATKSNGSLTYEKGERLVEEEGFTLGMSEKDGAYTVLGYYTMTQPIPGTDGSIVRIALSADPSLTVGTELQGQLTGIVLVEPNETNHKPEAVNFTITIAENRVVLDESSTSLPEEAQNVNVRVNRTINAEEWSTIVLPFAMTSEQVKEAFGNDVQLGDFISWSSNEDVDGNIVAISVGFGKVETIDANHPYIIKTSSPITEFDVDDVNIVVEKEPSVQVGTKKAERGYFIGTYVAQTKVPAQTLFLNDNKFWYSIGKTKMKAFRAYFDFYDVLSEVENISAQQNVKMIFNDYNTTGIITIDTSKLATDESIYDLQGRRISEASEYSSWPSTLKNGIYIKHGKKVVIK